MPIAVEEGIIRIGDLAEREDLWWHLPDPAVERPGDIDAFLKNREPIGPAEAPEHVAPRVMAALGPLMRVGTPFVEALALEHCGKEMSPRNVT